MRLGTFNVKLELQHQVITVSTKVETLQKSERENVNTNSLLDSLLEKKVRDENHEIWL